MPLHKKYENELVCITLKCFDPLWNHVVQCICVHDKLPTFEKLWEDVFQEDTRLEMVSTKLE